MRRNITSDELLYGLTEEGRQDIIANILVSRGVMEGTSEGVKKAWKTRHAHAQRAAREASKSARDASVKAEATYGGKLYGGGTKAETAKEHMEAAHAHSLQGYAQAGQAHENAANLHLRASVIKSLLGDHNRK